MTIQLFQDDAAFISAFSGEPVQTLVMTLASSVLTGIYMWPFALLSLGVIPFMGFASALKMK
jgi:hypothetical protein